MSSQYRQYYLLATVFLTLLFPSCAIMNDVTQGIGSAFKGNTKRNPQNYTLEDKKIYKKYKNQQKLEEKYQEKEILKRMAQTPEIK